MKINQLIIKTTSVAYTSLFIYFIYKSLPEEYYYTYALINSLLLVIALPTLISLLFTSLTVFHHVCYNLIIRFNAINKRFAEFSKIKIKTSKNHSNYLLLQLLREHNQVCYDLYQFDHFWRVYLAIKYLFFPLTIQLCVYIAFFTSTNFIFQFTFFSGACFSILCLSCDCITASMVNQKAHECYSLLNQIFLDTRLSLHVKIKLNNYIERLNGKSLVFTCSNLFNVTYATYFNVS
jgi:hypothetical protein